MDIKRIVSEIVERKKADGGIKQVYFVGCGGSLGAFVPAKTFMEMEARDIRTGLFNSGEFIHSIPAAFGKNTVLVVIDMNDFKATDEFGTVIASLGDLLIKGKTLVSYGKQEEMDRRQCVMVNEVKPLHALSTKIHFLEVYCS